MTSSTPLHKCRRGSAKTALIWLLAWFGLGGFFLYKAAPKAPPAAEVNGSSLLSCSTTPSCSHTKNIEDVKAGDRVWSYNPLTGNWEPKQVLKPLTHNYSGDVVTVTVAGQTVAATGNHPFWVEAGQDLNQRPYAQDVPMAEQSRPTRGRWVDARRLQAGDVLVLKNGGLAAIEMVTVQEVSEKVYNLKVADLHTYAVGAAGIAVHNKPCFPPGTLVLMGDGGTKAIEKIQPGDVVLATDPEVGGPASPAEVTGLIRDLADGLVRVTIEGPQGAVETVRATRFHPFWTTIRGWVDTKDLASGDELLGPSGERWRVVSADAETPVTQSFNLRVAKLHTYFVCAGHACVLVHNSEIPLAPQGVAPNYAAPVVNIGGEGEVAGAINVQPPGALGAGWASAGRLPGSLGPGADTAVPGGLNLQELRTATGSQFVVADPKALPFADGSVPTVVTNGAPVDTPPTVYGPSIDSAEINRILKPGGQYIQDGVPRLKPTS